MEDGSTRKIKQVLVLRKDLKMRKGKMIVQGSHACFLAAFPLGGSDILTEWLESGMTKVAVSVDSLEELQEVYDSAKKAKLTAVFVIDKGTTEFHGVPTPTAVAIGPDDAEETDKITGHLPLL